MTITANMKAIFAKAATAKATAEAKGYEYLPSVNGPYIYCGKTNSVIASYGSEKFNEICGN
jgi:hypothetical protein